MGNIKMLEYVTLEDMLTEFHHKRISLHEQNVTRITTPWSSAVAIQRTFPVQSLIGLSRKYLIEIYGQYLSVLWPTAFSTNLRI